ncbi:MAG: PIN domain-containing protein [Planctomycetia bacterium]|nr:PIN domain-containing protein [Planctomycetia bacterium]
MNAIDTNVLVYAIDFHEPVKQAKARDLLSRLSPASTTTLLWQVAGEYLSCLRRFAAAGRFPAGDIDADILDLLEMFPLALPTENVIPRSLSLISRYSLSHWDSLLIAACIEAGVNILYTEDLAADMKYDTVSTINPFS